VIESGGRARTVDDLQLGELGEAFLGELSADASLLGAAEWDVRRHVKMLVDPHCAGFDLARHLVCPLRIG
jgi:hypothetical protein